MSQLRKTAKSISTIIVFSLGSKLLGFIREALIAAKYGSGQGTDTFFIALSAVSLFSILLIETINTTLIPVLAEIEIQEGKEGKKKHLNNFLNIIVIVALLIAIIAFFLTPSIIKVIGRGFEGEQFEYAILLTRIGLPTLMISSIVGTFRGYLQSEERFIESAIADIPVNFVYIFFLMFIAEYFSITALMITAMLADVSMLLIQLPSLKRMGYHYKFKVSLTDKYMKQIVLLIPPVLLSVGISDLNNLVDKSMASSLIDGSVSALNYASILNGVVLSVFVAAIVTVVFPILSKEVNAKNYIKLKEIIRTSLNVVLLITIPASIGMIVLATPVVKFAYQRGEFGIPAALMTSSALTYYSIGLIGSGMKILLTRVYYALQDTKTPMINSLYALILNVLFNLIFVRTMDHNGLALASSLSITLTSIILLYQLRNKIGNLGLRKMMQSSFKILVSSIIMGGVVYLLYNSSVNLLTPSRSVELVIVVLTVLVGVAVYLVFLYLFKVEELHFLINSIKNQMQTKK